MLFKLDKPIMPTNDKTYTLEELKKIKQQFVDERNWNQFHTPNHLAAKIAIEAGELLEKFVWLTSEQSFAELATNRQEIEDEFADIFMLLLCFANATKIDMTATMMTKLEKVKAKYPIDKAKGVATKYTKL